jgi:hypothetical protein
MEGVFNTLERHVKVQLSAFKAKSLLGQRAVAPFPLVLPEKQQSQRSLERLADIPRFALMVALRAIKAAHLK